MSECEDDKSKRERVWLAITMGLAIAAFWSLCKWFFGLPAYNYAIALFFGVAVGGFFYLGTEGMGDHYEDSN